MAEYDDAFLTPLLTVAVQLHELFTNLVAAGFNEEQAIRIVIGIAQKENN
jgi:hypothetical protein